MQAHLYKEKMVEVLVVKMDSTHLVVEVVVLLLMVLMVLIIMVVMEEVVCHLP